MRTRGNLGILSACRSDSNILSKATAGAVTDRVLSERIGQVVLQEISSAYDSINAMERCVHPVFKGSPCKFISLTRRIRNTPIPFPMYQLCNVMITFFCVTVPLVISSYNTAYSTAPVYTFMLCLSFVCLNRVGNELQDVSNYFSTHFTCH